MRRPIAGDASPPRAPAPRRWLVPPSLRRALAAAAPRFVRVSTLRQPAYRALALRLAEHGVDLRDAVVDPLVGVATLPASALVAAVMRTPDFAAEYASFADYHRAYCAASDRRRLADKTSDAWPVLLDADPDQVIDDGWHRFHAYVARGLRRIPVLFFVAAGARRAP